jgi:hypothetical protein
MVLPHVTVIGKLRLPLEADAVNLLNLQVPILRLQPYRFGSIGAVSDFNAVPADA